MSRTFPCRGCGRTITFAIGPNDKSIPLEIPNLYTIGPDGHAAKFVSESPLYVSHFTTCPKASDFSRTLAEKGKV